MKSLSSCCRKEISYRSRLSCRPSDTWPPNQIKQDLQNLFSMVSTASSNLSLQQQLILWYKTLSRYPLPGYSRAIFYRTPVRVIPFQNRITPSDLPRACTGGKGEERYPSRSDEASQQPLQVPGSVPPPTQSIPWRYALVRS